MVIISINDIVNPHACIYKSTISSNYVLFQFIHAIHVFTHRRLQYIHLLFQCAVAVLLVLFPLWEVNPIGMITHLAISFTATQPRPYGPNSTLTFLGFFFFSFLRTLLSASNVLVSWKPPTSEWTCATSCCAYKCVAKKHVSRSYLGRIVSWPKSLTLYSSHKELILISEALHKTLLWLGLMCPLNNWQIIASVPCLPCCVFLIASTFSMFFAHAQLTGKAWNRGHDNIE